jgi:hypothetical protein
MIGLLLSQFSIWRNIQFGSKVFIMLNFIETYNSHSKTNLVTGLSLLQIVPLYELSLAFIEILPISHYFQFGKTSILARNVQLC